MAFLAPDHAGVDECPPTLVSMDFTDTHFTATFRGVPPIWIAALQETLMQYIPCLGVHTMVQDNAPPDTSQDTSAHQLGALPIVCADPLQWDIATDAPPTPCDTAVGVFCVEGKTVYDTMYAGDIVWKHGAEWWDGAVHSAPAHSQPTQRGLVSTLSASDFPPLPRVLDPAIPLFHMGVGRAVGGGGARDPWLCKAGRGVAVHSRGVPQAAGQGDVARLVERHLERHAEHPDGPWG